MKTKIIILILGLMLGLLAVWYFNKPEPLAGLTEREMEDLFLQRIAISQDDFLKTKGTYWQGMRDKNSKPHYQDKSMNELVDTTGITLDVKIDQYRTHLGDRGYHVYFYKDGLLKRDVNYFKGLLEDNEYILPQATST